MTTPPAPDASPAHASPPDDGFRSLVENSIDAIVVHDHGEILYANPAVAALLGAASPEAMLGQSVWPFVHPDDVTDVQTRMAVLHRERGSESLRRQRLLRCDGTVIHVEMTASAVRFSGRDGILMVGSDASERVRAEAALVRSEARLARVLASTDLILFSLEPTPPFRALFVSAGVAENTGHDPSVMLDSSFIFDQIHPEDRDAAMGKLAGESDRDRSDLEYRWRKADGDYLWASTVIHRVRDAQGVVVELHGVAMDITARKLSEAALREKEAQLRQATKMEAIGRLAGGIAHDFNNLLTVINNSASMLAHDLTDPALRNDANEILRAGERAAGLTRQLLAFSRKSVIVPQPMRLGGLLHDMTTMLARTLGETIRLTVQAPPDLWLVKADVSHIEQVVMNLALNARDAMPDGGALTLTLANVRAHSGELPEGATGDHVRLEVSDTGAGIAPEVLPHIFEPFFTTKEDAHGTGLGLATVLGNVLRSGGRITVESAAGRGTTFRVYLPRTSEPSREVAGPLARAEGKAKGTILLVEDEAPVRALTNRILVRAGYAVVEANTGNDAIALYRLHPDRFDLVLTDVVMPEGTGRDVADAVRALRPEQPVLFMSGYSEEMISHRGFALSGVRLLNKPFSATEMMTAVAETIQSARRST